MTVIPFPTREPPPEEPTPEEEPSLPTFAEFVETEVLDFISTVQDLPGMSVEAFWLEVEDLRNRINHWSPDKVTFSND